MALMFGSPEANAILKRNKVLERTAVLDEVDADWREEVEGKIEEAQDEIDELEAEIGRIEDRIARMKDDACPLTGLTYAEIERLEGEAAEAGVAL